MSTLEENEKIFQKEYEAMQSERSSKRKHEAVFSDEKLEDEGKVITVCEERIPINRRNKCNELNSSVTLDTKKIENTINSCVMSTDILNINQPQLISKENDETIALKYHTTTVENISDIRQETLQRPSEIIECNMSNDINSVQNKYANKVINEVNAKVNVCNNKMQINNSLTQKQGKCECILVY